MAVSKRVRYEVMRRDGHACRYCGAMAPDAKLTIDHVMPTALGGSDDPTNLATACAACNAGKSSAAPDQSTVAEVSDDAIRWAAAMREAAAQLRTERESREEEYAEFHRRWHAPTFASGGKTYYMNGAIPSDWIDKLETYRSIGMTLDDLYEGIDILDRLRWCPKEPFAYYLGIMNNKAAALQERARLLLDGEA